MSRPTARVLQLLDLLQSAGTRTLTELAGRLEVDERTIRRYLNHLRDLGVPVESIRGRHGGYRIAAGYRMPPLMLGEEEALAVLYGLVDLRARGDSPVPPMATETAIAKMRRALPRGVLARAEGLIAAAVMAPDRPHARTAPDVLLGVADAVAERRPLRITYRSADGTASARTVHPHDLVSRHGRWYLSALDLPSGEVRTFRLDRVRSVRAEQGHFLPPPPHDAVADLVERFATADYAHTARLRIRATPDQIRAVLPQSVAVLEPLGAEETGEGGWQRATVRAERLDWLPGLLLGLAAPVVIEGPDELREACAAAAARLRALATGAP